VGRWTQPDPLDQTGNLKEGNLYLYVGADPVNLIDPSGTHILEDAYSNLKDGAKGVARATGALGLACYAVRAGRDDDNSLYDEGYDLNQCFNSTETVYEAATGDDS